MEELGSWTEKIIHINIEDEMKTAYIDYSMSVIVSRALPDVRDGLKPVHRRVLYGMTELGLAHNRPFKKSARIVGEVLGKYHPHGDSSVYETMVRMAQEWSLRYLLVDGQGNFGSIDGDNPAALRYTEARLTKLAEELLTDLDKDTVDFRPNFDESLKEPTVLPAKFPNLLVNGASGIAVGMATNMPPHNLREVIEGIVAYIENNDITIDDLRTFIKAPDFPTGGIIYGYEGVKNAFETGRGRIVLRGKTEIEELPNGRQRIIISEIPYQVNKANMVAKTADLVNEKVIEGISEIRDESDRSGMRVVYEIKKDADAHVVLNKLYKNTQLQNTFNVNNIALVKGRPIALNLLDLIRYFVEHRHEVVVRRTQFELNEAEKRAHILEGLLIALDHLDQVIALIRSSQTPDIARTGLMETFGLSEIQAKAILDMRLQRLTGLERDKIRAEFDELMKTILRLKEILADKSLRMDIIKEELIGISEKFGDDRRTQIVYSGDDLTMEDLIPDEEVVVTISHLGYIKRTTSREYKRQGKGGRGSRGASSREEDFIEDLFTTSNHGYMLLFTENGKCYWLRVYEIPEGSKNSKGRPIQNVIQIEAGDKVRAYITVKNLSDSEYVNNNYIFFCTKKGVIKKTALESYSRPRQRGIIAINIAEDDQLLGAMLTNDTRDVIMATKYGQAIRFEQHRVRPMGRNSTGVRGVRLSVEEDNEVIGMINVPTKVDNESVSDETILVVSSHGYGKRSDESEYRVTNRGGKGIRTMLITEKTGQLVGILNVKEEENDLLIITKNGILIRMPIGQIRSMGRATQGVRLIKLNSGDDIASIALVEAEEEEMLEVLVENEFAVTEEGVAEIKDQPTDADADEPVELDNDETTDNDDEDEE
ncbi:MAG: DNA gyrase subunit A [Bacteroidota bacterium]|nr:DNA gyrase subunit A [Bacteroidota bacterium]